MVTCDFSAVGFPVLYILGRPIAEPPAAGSPALPPADSARDAACGGRAGKRGSEARAGRRNCLTAWAHAGLRGTEGKWRHN